MTMVTIAFLHALRWTASTQRQSVSARRVSVPSSESGDIRASISPEFVASRFPHHAVQRHTKPWMFFLVIQSGFVVCRQLRSGHSGLLSSACLTSPIVYGRRFAASLHRYFFAGSRCNNWVSSLCMRCFCSSCASIPDLLYRFRSRSLRRHRDFDVNFATARTTYSSCSDP